MGRHKTIGTPEMLLEYFEDYRKWAKENPYKWHDYVGKDATEVWKSRERPLTWIGFEAYLAQQGIVTQLTHYEQNRTGTYTDFLPIITRIKAICKQDIIEGAAAGVYQQNIAARVVELPDITQVEHKGFMNLDPLEEDGGDKADHGTT